MHALCCGVGRAIGGTGPRPVADVSADAATVFAQIGDQPAHRGEIGRVKDEAAPLSRRHQPGHREFSDMERQRCRRQAERTPDFSRGEALRAVFDQQTEYAQPRFVRQRSECAQGG